MATRRIRVRRPIDEAVIATEVQKPKFLMGALVSLVRDVRSVILTLYTILSVEESETDDGAHLYVYNTERLVDRMPMRIDEEDLMSIHVPMLRLARVQALSLLLRVQDGLDQALGDNQVSLVVGAAATYLDSEEEEVDAEDDEPPVPRDPRYQPKGGPYNDR